MSGKIIQYDGPPMAIYYDAEYREKDVDIEVAVPIRGNVQGNNRIKVRSLEGMEQAACLIHRGPYEGLKRSYMALMGWVEANQLEISGPDREVYLKGPDQNSTGNPEEYITEIQIPVRR
jgi:effector-binding domain-containing protein